MKAHKYWSLASLGCMSACFVTGFRKQKKLHAGFAFASLACMGMAIFSGHRLIAPKKKQIDTEAPINQEEQDL